MSAVYRGARWWRCDLHVHTPFDRRRFGEDLRQVEAALEDGNDAPLAALAGRFWAACAGVDVVGLTDHNSITGFRLLKPMLETLARDARARSEHTPVFLPGVEMAVGAERSMHFLVLFSAECSPDTIQQVVQGVFGANATHDGTGNPLPSGKPVGDFLTDLKAFCNPDNGERRVPFLVVPAHVESHTGVAVETGARDRTGPDLLQEMRGILRERAITRAAWHGFQTTHAYADLPQALRSLLCVWEANRRDKRWSDLSADEKGAIEALEHWPLIEASDPETHEQIGRRYSWLKMAEPDLEGVRMALLDPESRLRRMEAGEPGRNHPQIRSLSIKRTDFIEDLELALSANMTTLIGGRGSGKSTIIELLRYGLGRDQPSDFDQEERETRDAIERLLRTKAQRDGGATPGMLLTTSQVEVVFGVGGVEYRSTRSPDSLTVERLTPGDSGLPEGVPLDVRSLLKPQILSQRQIAGIARDPSAQRREIDRIVAHDPRAGEFDRRRITLDAQLEQAQADLRTALDDQRRLGPSLTELQTVRDQLQVLESGASRETLQRYQRYEREARLLSGWRAFAETAAQALQEAGAQTRAAAERVEVAGDASEFLTSQADSTKAALRTAADTASGAEEELTARQRDMDQLQQTEWEPLRSAATQAYEQLLGELQAQGISLEQHATLVAQRGALEERIAALRDSSARVAGLEEGEQVLRRELEALHLARNEARNTVSVMLEEQNADIRLVAVPFGDRASVEQRRDDWFGGANLHATDWDVLLDWVFAEDPGIADRWRAMTEALIQDHRPAKEQEASEGTNLRALLGATAGRLSGHLWRSIPRMEVTHLESICRSLPEDRVDASVRDPEGEFKPIEQGSLGQRSTAILSLLLSSGDQPLVIDQPEEDLDNQYVYRVVVDLLRKRKFMRQLILATHNANIPVNGDAELIVSMKVDNKLGVLDSVGSIDQQAVKDDVNSILEGSADAFRLRRRRYGY